MKPEEAILEYHKELARIYGEELTSQVAIYYGRGGWFYVSRIIESKRGKLTVDPLLQPVRTKEFLLKLEEVRKLQSRGRV